MRPNLPRLANISPTTNLPVENPNMIFTNPKLTDSIPLELRTKSRNLLLRQGNGSTTENMPAGNRRRRQKPTEN